MGVCPWKNYDDSKYSLKNHNIHISSYGDMCIRGCIALYIERSAVGHRGNHVYGGVKEYKKPESYLFLSGFVL